MEIAEHKALMQAEIYTALDTISKLGETSDAKSANEVIEENRDWSILLDRLFDEVANFARERGYDTE